MYFGSLFSPNAAGGGGISTASGAVVSGTLGEGIVFSGNVASGQLGQNHFASGAVLSGAIASGQLGPNHLAPGSVLSGAIASGQVFTFHIASGGLLSGAMGSGQIGTNHLSSGSVVSGSIASGQIGVNHLAAGIALASGIVVSGYIASGQVGRNHFANGCVFSGALASGQLSWPNYELGTRRNAAQFNKTSDTTLADITGMSVAVQSGKTYRFRAVLFSTADAAGGIKYAIAGTATATAVMYGIVIIANPGPGTLAGRQTALGGATGQTASADNTTFIDGVITVDAGGTLTVQFAQNASNIAASSVLVGSQFTVEEIP